MCSPKVPVSNKGVSVGAPAFAAYPNQPWLSVLYGAIAGFAHPLGAIIGYAAFGNSHPNEVGMGLVYSLIAGMLLTIAIKGLLPYARSIDKRDSVTSGAVLLGALLIYFSISMFSVAGFDHHD